MVLMKSANEIEEMKVRNEGGQFYKYDKMNTEFMFPFKNHVAGYIGCEMKDDLQEFIKEYDSKKENSRV